MQLSVRERAPIVHCITNQVVANFQANGLLAVGSSPIMGDEEKEVAQLVSISDALSLNIGTLSERTLKSMLIAGKRANEEGIPIVLDPVGVGVSEFRREAVKKIMDVVKVDLIRCNTGELATLMGGDWISRGVDAGKGHIDRNDLAKKLAKQMRTLVVVSGEVDLVSDGQELYTVNSGDICMTRVTGTGCLLSSLLGAHLTLSKVGRLEILRDAVLEYGRAGEEAARISTSVGTFASAFLDQLSKKRWEYDSR